MIIVASLLLVLTLSDSQQLQSPYNQCQLNYHSINSTLLFDSCIIRGKDSQSFSSWSECCVPCCRFQDSICPDFNAISMMSCQTHVQNTQKLSKFVIGVMVGISFLGLACAICLLCWCLHKKPSRKIANVQGQSEESILRRIKWTFKQENLQQTMQTINNENHTESVCTICLGTQSNMQISCGHWYHLHCFLIWLKKAKDCPLCRTTNLSSITIYCSKCFAWSTFLQFNSVMLAYDGLWKRSRLCDRCLTDQINGNSQSFVNLKKQEQIQLNI